MIKRALQRIKAARPKTFPECAPLFLMRSTTSLQWLGTDELSYEWSYRVMIGVVREVGDCGCSDIV